MTTPMRTAEDEIAWAVYSADPEWNESGPVAWHREAANAIARILQRREQAARRAAIEEALAVSDLLARSGMLNAGTISHLIRSKLLGGGEGAGI